MKQRRPLCPPKFFLPLSPCNTPIRRCSVSREEASHRILIIRTGAFGDILMGTSLLASLRLAFPKAHLTWLVEHSEVQAIDANPYIDEYLQWDSAFWKKMLRRGLYPWWIIQALRARKLLREKKYDILISFQPEEWPLLLQGVAAAMTVGIFDTFRRFYGVEQTSRYTRLYTYAYTHPNLPEHRIDQYLLTLEALGIPPAPYPLMSIGYTHEDSVCVDRFLSDQGITSDEHLIVLAPFTTWPTKCWNSERFVSLGDELALKGCGRIIIISSNKERSAAEILAAQMLISPIVAGGSLSFRQMAALIDRASLVVSGDTGPMHVAAALMKPQVALFGPTSPKWYGPKSANAISLLHPVPCGPCDQKACPNTGREYMQCMTLLPVEEVIKAALHQLEINNAHQI